MLTTALALVKLFQLKNRKCLYQIKPEKERLVASARQLDSRVGQECDSGRDEGSDHGRTTAELLHSDPSKNITLKC